MSNAKRKPKTSLVWSYYSEECGRGTPYARCNKCSAKIKGGGGGGGGGGQGVFFVKLDFEIAVDQQTRTGDPTFGGGGGGPGLRPPTGARGAATPIFGPNLAQFWQIT